MTPKGNSPLTLLHVLPFSDSLIRYRPAGRRQKKRKDVDPALSTLTNGRNEPDKIRTAKKRVPHKRKARGFALYKKSRLFLRKINFLAKLPANFLVFDFSTKGSYLQLRIFRHLVSFNGNSPQRFIHGN